ncbi:DUF3261 domain-containing protein [Ramlibacter sp. XY19]|uniref:DUF3261 domain-containing protein n=1 Tax=Ramlibacter paludis TaxID=2908000 RepID=UPI0023DB1CC7|nr:DUF3261 domain-containing protein [Ramlibacter paludis]MCG2594669.1 DUF3261 domain-containing protein [Ramlibacter paludis]
MRWLFASLLLLLSACATPVPQQELVLRLSPASLGRELALQQRMTVSAHGRSQQMDVALEVDAAAVRMAVMDFGQTVARLDWDGRELTETRAPGWPPTVTGARVLSDLQLVHWPLPAIRGALPAGYSIDGDAAARTVRFHDATLVRVRYPAPGTAELDNLAGGYQLRLDAWPGSAR